MKKKIVYIIPVIKASNKNISPGVDKKVKNQIKSLECCGFQVSLLKMPLLPIPYRILPFASSSIDWSSIELDNTTDVLYIRYSMSDYQFIRFLRNLKQNNPKIKIIIELPSYPYESEQTSKIKFYRDVFYRRFLHKYIDRITIYSNDRYVLKIPCINLKNGICVDDIKPRVESVTDEIRLVSVALFDYWHGIDRLIKGIKDYYDAGGKRKIKVSLVGPNNSIVQKLKGLTNNLGLNNVVTFTGPLYGEDLDRIYDYSNIAVECLGLHRKGDNLISSSLKSREYLAKGIPFIYSGIIDVIDSTKSFYTLRVDSNESNVDLNKVIDFFDYLHRDKKEKEIIDNIRQFAYYNVDMKKSILPVVEYIVNGK